VSYIEDGPAGSGWYFDVSSTGQWQGPHGSESAAKSEGFRQTNFKRLILNRCQHEFMKEQAHKDIDLEQAEDDARRTAGGLSASEERELAERAAARDYARLKAKRRMLSNISFIGQLYRIEGMLTVQIMHFCIGRLLNGGVIPDDVKPDEEQMEAFVKLMVRLQESWWFLI
jgi:translation initiation factor 4G